MESGFISRENLDAFLSRVRPFGELHGPTVSGEGVYRFSHVEDAGELVLDYRRTLIPPKKYLLPFREEILSFRDGNYLAAEGAAPPIVLLGLHPCDLQGIEYLDRVFLADRPDPSYARRRAALTLIGLSCEPDDYCFCSSPLGGAPCDLFMRTVPDGFLVSVQSSKGGEVMKAAAELLEPGRQPDGEPSAGSPIGPQDPQLRFSDHPLWQEFASRCVSCGACSVCCPTCYCFDVREYPGLNRHGVRVREWDNCLFATHGEVAGGNFRPTRLDRLRYRFLHKYCGFSPLAGMCSCVGCGRCREACPVDIDLRELLKPAQDQEAKP